MRPIASLYHGALLLSSVQISKAFTTQYYNVLHKQPTDVHKFYREGSRLSRAEGLTSPLDSASTVAVSDGHV